jgi:hypothetical protein
MTIGVGAARRVRPSKAFTSMRTVGIIDAQRGLMGDIGSRITKSDVPAVPPANATP